MRRVTKIYNTHTIVKCTANISNKILYLTPPHSPGAVTFIKLRLCHFIDCFNYLFELFLKRRGTMKLILSARFYHLCLSLFSNCINISNLNSDNLFLNNHEARQLSTINICLVQ